MTFSRATMYLVHRVLSGSKLTFRFRKSSSEARASAVTSTALGSLMFENRVFSSSDLTQENLAQSYYTHDHMASEFYPWLRRSTHAQPVKCTGKRFRSRTRSHCQQMVRITSRLTGDELWAKEYVLLLLQKPSVRCS